MTRHYVKPVTEHTYYVVPEFTMPEDVTDAAVAAANPDATAWNMLGRESMNPFWAVERKTQKEMRNANETNKTNHTFNVQLEHKTYQVAPVGVVGDTTLDLVTLVEVPILVNPDKLCPGDELFLEMEDQKKKRRKAQR